jgi:hypothetical protein
MRLLFPKQGDGAADGIRTRATQGSQADWFSCGNREFPGLRRKPLGYRGLAFISCTATFKDLAKAVFL